MAVKLVTDSALNKAMNLLTGDRDMILNVYDPAAGRRQVAFSDDLPTAEEKAEWSDSDVFIATYGVTTNAEIEAAYQAGKICAVCVDGRKNIYFLSYRHSASIHTFTSIRSNTANFAGATSYIDACKCENDEWSINSNFSVRPGIHASTHVSGGTDPLYGLYTADTDPTTNNFINWTYE